MLEESLLYEREQSCGIALIGARGAGRRERKARRGYDAVEKRKKMED